MGAFDDVANIVIPDPSDAEAAALFRRKWRWEAHEQALIKGTVTVADQEYVTNQYGQSGKKGNVEVQMGKGRFALLDRMIQDWTFVQNGQKVPVNYSNIRRLPANYSNAILEVIDGLATAMTEEEQEAFLDSANGHTVESSSLTSLSLLKS